MRAAIMTSLSGFSAWAKSGTGRLEQRGSQDASASAARLGGELLDDRFVAGELAGLALVPHGDAVGFHQKVTAPAGDHGDLRVWKTSL